MTAPFFDFSKNQHYSVFNYSPKTSTSNGKSTTLNISALMAMPSIGVMTDSTYAKGVTTKAYLPGLAWTFNNTKYDAMSLTSFDVGFGISARDDTKNSIGLKGISMTFSPLMSIDAVSFLVGKAVKAGSASIYMNGTPCKATV